MNYSFNFKGEDYIFAQSYDINASYKDLGAVCDAIRYLRAEQAIVRLDKLIAKAMPIPYRRHNKHMGSRHELGGAKGGYPVKAAAEVRKTLANAIANAGNKGKEGADMMIIGAAANKTRIERRYPSKGSIAWGRGMYGKSATNHSDIEYAKIEIVLADEFSNKLTDNMKYFIKKRNKPLMVDVVPKKGEKATKAPMLPKAAKPVVTSQPKQQASAQHAEHAAQKEHKDVQKSAGNTAKEEHKEESAHKTHEE